jgi:hypothetical protein
MDRKNVRAPDQPTRRLGIPDVSIIRSGAGLIGTTALFGVFSGIGRASNLSYVCQGGRFGPLG